MDRPKGITDITDYIPVGHQNAISRVMLAKLTGLNDRSMREQISRARRYTPILNLQDGGGYYIPDKEDPADVAALRKFKTQESKRAKSIFWSLKATNDALAEVDQAI